MKHLKTFESFSLNEKIHLFCLFDNQGTLIDKNGYVEEGVGIFDEEGNEYPAGYSVDRKLYASKIGPDGEVLSLDEEEPIPGLYINDMDESEEDLYEKKEEDSKLKAAGVEGYNKPKRTPNHPTKSHIVVAKEGDKTKTIRFGEQGAKTAGKPKKGESEAMKKKRKSFKARHSKNIKKGKMSAAYWADKSKW